ncbi:response regulator transcription factor [Novosphingobium sp.]|uniref:response regulator transcription factor n=1 Tax=Novosphingobium sp. TaxID=1874826 RepID=UPI002FDEFBB6
MTKTDAGCSRPIVLVVDDDELQRLALDALLASVGIDVLPFDSARALLDAALPDAPTCLVLDVRMPHMGGFECHRQLLARGNDIPTIFVTGHGDIGMAVEAMKTGAVDFLAKPYREQDMLEAVHAALATAAERRAAAEEACVLRNRFATLTPRECQVMAGVVRGLLNKQIAFDMGISEITVKLHRASLMRKMQMRTVPDLVRAVDRIGPQVPVPQARLVRAIAA